MHPLLPAGPVGHLGIDVGGTKVALRIEAAPTRPASPASPDSPDSPAGADAREDRVEAVEAVEATFRWRASADAAEDLAELAANVAALRTRWPGPVTAVGVAMPATLDPDGRVTTWPGRATWAGLDLAGALRNLVPGASVAVGDDGDLAALAEAAAVGCADLVYLGVGTGIGGGIVLGGRPCPGPARGSSEIGHLIIAFDGPRCGCGRRGCVQAIASGPATLRRATERRALADKDTTDSDTTDSDTTGRHTSDMDATDRGEVTFAELRTAWLTREPWAVDVIGESAAALAAVVVGLTEILRPSLAVIGGGFADGLPGFVAAVAEHAAALARPGHAPAPVRPAVLGGLSSLSGALVLARQAS